MSPETSARLMRSSIAYTTAPAMYRSRRMSRRDRKAAVRVAFLCALALAYFIARSV